MKDINFYEQLQLTRPPLSTTDFTPDELEKNSLTRGKRSRKWKSATCKRIFYYFIRRIM